MLWIAQFMLQYRFLRRSYPYAAVPSNNASKFGHNDMKLADFTETFKANLRQMIADVKAKKGVPVMKSIITSVDLITILTMQIIVTSLSRRNYNTDGTIADTLGPWAGYAIGVAQETGTRCVDLWKSSLHYLEQIGEPAARRLDLNEGDHTHLNVKGSIVFGRMVSDLLLKAISEIQKVTKPDTALSNQIWNGIATY